LENDPEKDLYKMMYKSSSRFWRKRKYMTSFQSVLRIEEVNRLILSGAMRLSSQYMAYRLLLKRMEFLGTPILSKDWRYPFFGGLLGIIVVGPSYDFLLSGSAYMILDTYTVITFIW
jgi:hypothetical protein